MPLTDVFCKNVKPSEKPRKHFDSSGLYLEVMPNGATYWRLKYRFLGKEKRLALGVYPEVSLKEARDKRDEARKLLSQNIDPSLAKKEEKRKLLINQGNSFESIAREWYEQRKESLSQRHATYVLRRLENDVFPSLGQRPIAEITAQELLSVIRVVESRGAIEIAHRILQSCGQIFLYAIVTGRADNNPAASLRGAIKTVKSSNYTSLKTAELPEFMQKLERYETDNNGSLLTKLALKLIILTMVRTGELRGAAWNEINFEAAEWRIPAERMKMNMQHIVPLSHQAIVILKELQKISSQSHFVFPNQSNLVKCMSENTMLYALYRMGYHNRTTVHGFRSLASTLLNETGFNADVIERQLAHCERNKVRAAYNHAQYLPERRKMMQWWADYIDSLREENKDVITGFVAKVA